MAIAAELFQMSGDEEPMNKALACLPSLMKGPWAYLSLRLILGFWDPAGVAPRSPMASDKPLLMAVSMGWQMILGGAMNFDWLSLFKKFSRYG